MNTILKYLTIILLTVFLFSCNEETFLEHDFVNSVVDDNFITQPSHADEAVVGMYDVIGYQGLWKWGRIMLGSSAADDVAEDHGDPAWADLINLDKYRWFPENLYIWEHWVDNYNGIKMANEIIDKVPNIEGLDASLSARYVAEAKCVRAMMYYNLVTAHGDVPLLLHGLGPEEARQITQSPADEVWAQIIQDLTDAKAVLPDSYSQEESQRVTKGAANAMLSKVYLWQKDYAKAESTALEVINSPAGYELEPEYADLFNGVSEYSAERIFAVNCAADIGGSMWGRKYDEGNRNYLWGPYFRWSWFMQPDRPHIDFSDHRVDTMTVDMRNGETYDKNNDGVIEPDGPDAVPASPPHDAHNLKYVPVNDNLNAGKIWGGGLNYVDVQVLRYSEVLLNYAEALVEQGQSSEALPYINMIRNRAKLGDVTTTNQNELRDIILNERKLEFCFEGKRFFDLKRVGRLEEFLGPLGFKSGKNENFPIPQSEIDITQMQQNPGY